MGIFRAKSGRGGRLRWIGIALCFVLIGWFVIAHYSDFKRIYQDYQIEKNLYRLKPGMSSSDVVEILGKPENIRGSTKTDSTNSRQLYEYRIVSLLFRSDQLIWISKPMRGPYGNLPIHKRIWYRTRDIFWPVDTRAS